MCGHRKVHLLRTESRSKPKTANQRPTTTKQTNQTATTKPSKQTKSKTPTPPKTYRLSVTRGSETGPRSTQYFFSRT